MEVTTENVVEICVALDIAIIGIAYPIVIEKISKIGEKYNSVYLANIFEKEEWSVTRKISVISISVKYLKRIIYLTLLSFLFLIFNFTAPAFLDFWFINNSASFLVIILSIVLVTYFFMWLEKVLLYVGSSPRLLDYLIGKYKILAETNSIRPILLKALNEICLYAIAKQDEHLQKTLEYFYYFEFKKYREHSDYDKSNEYPVDYYELVNKIHYEVSVTAGNRLRVLEHRAISGIWLLGEFNKSSTISETTYSWLWRNLSIISKTPHLVQYFWQNSYQHIQYSLRRIDPQYQYNPLRITNEEEIENRDKERKRFFEFHYALGGLMLYQKQYESINKMFTYTQSEPPSYPLLPSSMTEVFEWFDYFRNEYYHLEQPLDYRYWFSGLNSYGSEKKSTTWICYYLVILFFRMFKERNSYSHQSLTTQPHLPEDLNKLSNWTTSVYFFRNIINDLLKEKSIIKNIGYEELINNRIHDIAEYISQMFTSIDTKIETVKRDTPLSEDKITAFYESTKEIISEALGEYKIISNPHKPENIDLNSRTGIQGIVSLFPKSAFTDNDIPHLNFESVIASQAANTQIKRFIPNSFISSSTIRYAIHESSLLAGLDKIIGDNQDAVIVGMNLNFKYKQLLKESHLSKYLRVIPSTESHFKNFLFVLNRNDLPYFEHVPIKQEEIEEAKLKTLDEEMKLYASVVDFNLPENKYLKDKYSADGDVEADELKVLVFIAFIISINWSVSREIIQINISSQYDDQGSTTQIDDLPTL